MDRGAWQATVHGAAKSCTRLSNELRSFQLRLPVGLNARSRPGVGGGWPGPRSQSPAFRRGPRLGWCYAAAVLKFLIHFQQEALRFHFALAPQIT